MVRRGSTVEVVVSKGVQTVILPDLKGVSKEEGIETIEELGLVVGKVTAVSSDTVEKGNVVSHTPFAATELQKNDKVNLVISIGQKFIIVPYLIRKKIPTAQKLLEQRGLKLGRISQTTNIEHIFGVILSQSPKPGIKVKKGISVDVVVNTEAEE